MTPNEGIFAVLLLFCGRDFEGSLETYGPMEVIPF